MQGKDFEYKVTMKWRHRADFPPQAQITGEFTLHCARAEGNSDTLLRKQSFPSFFLWGSNLILNILVCCLQLLDKSCCEQNVSSGLPVDLLPHVLTTHAGWPDIIQLDIIIFFHSFFSLSVIGHVFPDPLRWSMTASSATAADAAAYHDPCSQKLPPLPTRFPPCS